MDVVRVVTKQARVDKGTSRCAQCGAPIDCRPGADCWCAALPFRPMPEGPSACFCRACLERQPPLRSPAG